MHSYSRFVTKGIAAVSFAALSLFSTAANAQPFNGTLNFSETAGQRVEVASSASLSPTNAITFEAWIYMGPTTNGQPCKSLFGKGWTTTYWFGVCSGKFRSYTKGTGSNYDAGDIPENTWTHVAVTSNRTTRYHYVNGALVGTFNEPTPGSAFPTNANPVMIGNDPSWDYPPNGKIDEVRLWSVARSQDDIKATMRVALDTKMTGLVSVWHLDGSASDMTGTNAGQLFGGAQFSTAPVGGFCAPNDTRLCLKGGRFSASVNWKTSDGTTGTGKVVPGYSDEAGMFWFFNASNWELMIKALDGCPVNARKWVFSAATTNVEYTLTVRDLVANQSKVYTNTQGVSAPAVTDTGAFATCP